MALPHLALYTACVLFVKDTSWAMVSVLVLLAGHSLASLAFVAHDLSHGSILPACQMRRTCEFVFWGLNCVPRTLWRRLHNETHHVHAATRMDPDRDFAMDEMTRTRWLYGRLFYPSREGPLRWNPLALLHFPPYITRNLAAALIPGFGSGGGVVPAPTSCRRGDRRRICIELIGIACMQILVWRMAGSLLAYVLIGPTAILVTSAVTMTYIFTNHFLNPILPSADPLLGTTSVVVPWWMDKLPSNFSYHVEHHLFPAMSPRFYPEVSRLLRANHSDRYQRIGLLEAWKSLARRPPWAIVADNEIGLVPKPAGRRE